MSMSMVLGASCFGFWFWFWFLLRSALTPTLSLDTHNQTAACFLVRFCIYRNPKPKPRKQETRSKQAQAKAQAQAQHAQALRFQAGYWPSGDWQLIHNLWLLVVAAWYGMQRSESIRIHRYGGCVFRIRTSQLHSHSRPCP